MRNNCRNNLFFGNVFITLHPGDVNILVLIVGGAPAPTFFVRTAKIQTLFFAMSVTS